MSTLADLVRARAELDDDTVEYLHALVAEWQLLSDLSFADLLLFVAQPVRAGAEPRYLCTAHVRPVTGPTVHYDDPVGTVVTAAGRPALHAAMLRGLPTPSEGLPETADRPAHLRTDAVPVRHRGKVVAVVVRDTHAAASRVAGQLERAYTEAADDIATMITEGQFPFRDRLEWSGMPRVGDGMLRLDARGVVAFASPNALSAYRRLGLSGNVVGARLHDVHTALPLVVDVAEAGRIERVLATRTPLEVELEADGAMMLLRGLPLLDAGVVRGALVLVQDVTEVRRRDRALMTKDATIREIHHRVKNNLQTVAALLRLQARRTPDAGLRLALGESVRRVTSIALVHETLSQALDETVAFDGIADRVAAMSVDLSTTGPRPRWTREGTFGELPATVATPLALVLSELVQNAVEHAFGGGEGDLRIRVSRGRGGLEVSVVDNGVGLPPGFQLDASNQLGLQIVRSLVVGELRGTLVLRPGAQGGTEAVVAIPAEVLPC